LFPEFLTSRDVSVELADRVLHWLEKPDEVTRLRLELAALRERVGQPGACARAAEIVLGFAVNRAAA
jgi:lipid-A-disaccharide synthase